MTPLMRPRGCGEAISRRRGSQGWAQMPQEAQGCVHRGEPGCSSVGSRSGGEPRPRQAWCAGRAGPRTREREVGAWRASALGNKWSGVRGQAWPGFRAKPEDPLCVGCLVWGLRGKCAPARVSSSPSVGDPGRQVPPSRPYSTSDPCRSSPPPSVVLPSPAGPCSMPRCRPACTLAHTPKRAHTFPQSVPENLTCLPTAPQVSPSSLPAPATPELFQGLSHVPGETEAQRDQATPYSGSRVSEHRRTGVSAAISETLASPTAEASGPRRRE